MIPHGKRSSPPTSPSPVAPASTEKTTPRKQKKRGEKEQQGWGSEIIMNERVKRSWTKEEDETIIRLVEKFGPHNWSFISSHLKGRIGKQCRERWHNQLSPTVRKEGWTPEEDRIIMEAHAQLGNKWALIAKRLNGRTDNAIKNRWNSSIKRRLEAKKFCDQNPLESSSDGNTPQSKKRKAEEDVLHFSKQPRLESGKTPPSPPAASSSSVSSVEVNSSLHETLPSISQILSKQLDPIKDIANSRITDGDIGCFAIRRRIMFPPVSTEVSSTSSQIEDPKSILDRLKSDTFEDLQPDHDFPSASTVEALLLLSDSN